jgi:pathogenesis-related protein 1
MRLSFWCILPCLALVTACNIDSLLPNENGRAPTARPGGSEADRLVGITQEHNRIRAAVSASPPLPDLAWSQDLADVAESYAKKLASSGCSLVHSQGPYGENLAFFGGQQATAAEVVDLWAGEKSCWTFGTFEETDSCSSACNDSGGCGHYTQVVWRDTKLVGCGVAACTNGDGEVWVCNYDPPGNFVGEKPY